MKFIYLDENKNIIKYPFTFDDFLDIKPEYKNKALVEDHFYMIPGVQGVHDSDPPACRYDQNSIADIPEQRYPNIWFQTWKIVPASAEEIQQRTEAETIAVRTKRDQLLVESDWTQLPDVPSSIREPHQSYRQALRDITDQPDFPWNINWPTKP